MIFHLFLNLTKYNNVFLMFRFNSFKPHPHYITSSKFRYNGSNYLYIFDIVDHDKGHSRVIVHFDIDCFYAQVEMLRNPALADKPVGELTHPVFSKLCYTNLLFRSLLEGYLL